MNLKQVQWILQDLSIRQQFLKACDFLKEGHIAKIRIWGYDSLQDAGSFCEVWWNTPEEILEGLYTTGVRSKWVSPFQCYQYIDRYILSDSDEIGMSIYGKEGEAEKKIMLGGEVLFDPPILNR